MSALCGKLLFCEPDEFVPYVPAAHVHTLHAVELASENVPAPHIVHGVEELVSWSIVPAAHGVHAVALLSR